MPKISDLRANDVLIESGTKEEFTVLALATKPDVAYLQRTFTANDFGAWQRSYAATLLQKDASLVTFSDLCRLWSGKQMGKYQLRSVVFVDDVVGAILAEERLIGSLDGWEIKPPQ